MTISITSGSGYAGSVYSSSDSAHTDWFADGELVAKGATFTLPLEHEGKKIRAGLVTPSSNTIEMWVPQTDLPGICAVMDIRTRRTPSTGAVQSWASRAKDGVASQATAANQPVYGADALGTGIPGLTFDGSDFLGGLAVGATSLSRTVVALARFGATSNRTVVGGVANSDFGFRRDNSRRMQVIASNAAAVATDTVAVPDNTTVLLLSRYTQATVADFRQNGAQTTNVVPGGNALAVSNTMQIGAALSTQQLIGVLGTIGIADVFATDDEALRLEGWIAHINGAAAFLPAGHPYKTRGPTVAQADTATNYVLLGDPLGIQARGRTIALLRRTIIGASPAAVQAKGQAASLQRAGTIGAAPGRVTGTGSDAELRVGRVIAAGSAQLATQGHAADVRAGRAIAALPAGSTTGGQDAALGASRRLDALPGRIDTRGRTATLTSPHDVVAPDLISRGGAMLRMAKLMGR